jgi:hypothetical protein
MDYDLNQLLSIDFDATTYAPLWHPIARRAQAIGQNSSVHRACAGTAHPDHLEIRLEQ